MNLTKSLLLSGCLVLGLASSGCKSNNPNDQALLTAIQAKLYADAAARSANVKVSVANGVATLTGDAPSSDVALDVVNIANGTSGITRVDNQLTIAGTPAAPASTPAPMSAPPSGSAVASNQPVQAPPPHNSEAAPSMPSEPPPPPMPVTVTIPTGTDIAVQMIDGISSKTNTTGQTFRASLSSPVVVNGKTVLPAGAGATVLLADAKGAGRIKGNSALEVRLVTIQHAGQTYQVDTNVHEVIGKGRGKQTAVRSGIGAAAGAVIGALAGGGKGAAIGSLAGGGAGAGFQLATHGEQVNIPSETQLTFTVQTPIVVTLHHDR
jgi:hypothetical protein